MKAAPRHLLNIFITGALAALPLAATVLIFVWGARLAVEYLGPESLVGGMLVRIGLGVTGSELLGYAIGVAAVMVALFLLGLLIQTRLRAGVAGLMNRLVQRIPIVRSVYDLVKKFVDILSQRDDQGLRSMSPVWLHFGGPGGAAVLGLLSTPEPVVVGGLPYMAVLVPTAPVPVGGGLLYVPSAWVTPAEMGAEGLTSIYVSMGITSRQYIGKTKGGR